MKEIPIINNEIKRDEWVKNTLTKLPAGSRILDAGAGERKYKKYCSHLIYVSQDFAKYEGVGNEKGLQTGSWDICDLDLICDIVDIPEKDESFDAILCTEVFEHLPEPISAIKEFSRLLCQGGKLILTAPFCSLTHFAPYHYYSGFNQYFYEKILDNNGFKILDLQPNGNYFEYIIQELQRFPSVSIQYSNDQPNIIERIALKCLIRMLNKFSQNNNGSEELLTFGYHVFAEKL